MAAMILTVIAAGFDLKYMKIPNKLNLVGILAGIAINACLYGLHSLATTKEREAQTETLVPVFLAFGGNEKAHKV